MKHTAFIFPGQGSQSIGMLAALAEAYPMVLELFHSVSEHLGYDVWSLIQEGPEAKLNQTEYTQVAMLVADVAVFRVIEKHAPMQIACMAGHSLGEYAALVAAHAIDLVDAAQLVAMRGHIMQEAVPLGQGAMAAIIGLADDVVQSICASLNASEKEVMPANYNALGQVVIAGHASLVEQAIQKALDAGALMAKLIPVSVPCHCSLLKDAAEQFAVYLEKAPFREPSIPVLSNVNLNAYASVDEIRTLLKEQLYAPVRWVETIQKMKDMGVTRTIECGPGKVLCGLVKRIDKSLQTFNVQDPESLSHLGSVDRP